MAAIPNPFVWQSKLNNRYLRLDGKIESQEGILEFTEEVPNHVFETEDPQISGYVNIKYLENNLYLTGVKSKAGEKSTLLIVATADTPNNNMDDKHCTLFELVKSKSTNDFRARHVHSKLFLRPHKVIDGHDAVLCAENQDPNPIEVDIFTAIVRP